MSNAPSRSSVVGHQNPEGKMLLPSLQRRISPISRNTEKNRTTHACDWCRKAKAKCTGGQPCQKCKNEGKECFYGDGKRDKERKNLERTTKQNESLRGHAELLRAALRGVVERLSLSESEQSRVSELLAKSPSIFSDGDDDDESPYPGPQQYTPRLYQHGGEKEASGDIGSTGSLYATDLDTNDDEESRAAGFLGKSSSVRWIQRAEREVDSTPNVKSGLPMYHTGDPDHWGPVDAVNRDIDDPWIYEMPAPQTAARLIDSYFVYVHPDFPILCKDEFMQRFHHYVENRGPGLSKTENMALCQINCVFAISSNFLSTTDENDDENGHRDHLIYYARIRALGLEHQQDYSETTQDYICALGLLGLYLVSNLYVNRAWNMVGVAIRNATALGLHLRSSADQISNSEKDLRVRIWWSLFSLERLLDEITGRPSCISYHDMSIPDQVDCGAEGPFKEESNSSRPSSKRRRSSAEAKGKRKAGKPRKPRENFGMVDLVPAAPMSKSFDESTSFAHRIGLNIITHEVLNRLFSPAIITKPWNEVQDTMRELDSRLQSWKRNLPVELMFPVAGNIEEDEHEHQKIGLAIMYHTARMILHRPCLCRMDGRIKNKSSASQKFHRDAVAKCVGSARALLATIRKPARTGKLHLIRPWWELLHHLCQAASILMLEIAFCVCHTRNEAPEVLQDAKDAVHWLRSMSRRSIPAYKAWQTHDRTLRLVATKINGDISDLAMDAEMPPGFHSTSAQSQFPPLDEEIMHGVDVSHQGLSDHQNQNLSTTHAWVQEGQQGIPQPPVVPPLEVHQFSRSAFPDQPQDFESMFRPSLDPYGTFDSPGFPWTEHGCCFADPSYERHGVENVGSYLPYGSGLASVEMVPASHEQEVGVQSSRVQSDNALSNIEATYQETRGQYPQAEMSYRQPWHGGDGG